MKDIQGDPQKSPYFSLAITFTKIWKTSRFFLHRYWKFIDSFGVNHSRINNGLLYFFSNQYYARSMNHTEVEVREVLIKLNKL